MPNTNTILIDAVSRRFEAVEALTGVSVEIRAGELFGFIGPDGAGKTTLIRILTTLLLPDEGQATVDGLDIVRDYKELRKRIGYMPGRFSLYQDLSVEENLKFFASVFGTSVEQNYDLIRSIYEQIEPFRNRKAGKLSGGMKQKLALCCALIHRPRVLFLDEPTTGVDAVSRREFWTMLNDIRASGITTVVSTPYMDEAKLCDRVALMQNGAILTTDTPTAIEKSYSKPLVAVKSAQKFGILKSLRAFEHADSVYAFGAVAHYSDKRDEVDLNELRDYLRSNGFVDAELTSIEAGIEDVFMAMTA